MGRQPRARRRSAAGRPLCRAGGRTLPVAERRDDPPPHSTPVEPPGSDVPAVESVQVNTGWVHAHHGTEHH
ncbi:hypothetical protein ACWGJW_11235 [Streptomyces nigrescens]